MRWLSTTPKTIHALRLSRIAPKQCFELAWGSELRIEKSSLGGFSHPNFILLHKAKTEPKGVGQYPQNLFH